MMGFVSPALTVLERDGLLEALDAARHEGGRLVFVGGEAGVGKTALVRGFAARVSDGVLLGACENLTTPAPLGPIADIAAELGGPLPELVASGAVARDVGRALVGRLTDGTVVVLEDVHWADEATLDALRVIGRRIDGTGALVVATYRDDEIAGDHPLRRVLGELASAPGVSRLSVPRLSLEAVRELSAPYGADGDAIHRLTLGNAFYATEVLAWGGAELPATVRDAVLARAASLHAAPRRLLDVVAVVPARTELWLLEPVARDELGHLDACLEAGCCARTAMPSRFVTSSHGLRSRARFRSPAGAGSTLLFWRHSRHRPSAFGTPRAVPITRRGPVTWLRCSSMPPPPRVWRQRAAPTVRRRSTTRARCDMPSG